MPKKRHHVKFFTPSSTASPTFASSSSSAQKVSTKSVNELLANLRLSSSASSTVSPHPTNTPSVPPAIREILQIPETPAPAPRRRLRERFDQNGRRLPAGPPPPRSWLTTGSANIANEGGGTRQESRWSSGYLANAIPGVYLPAPGSLIDVILRKMSMDWGFHRVYNQYHLYFIPNHLKPALIRWITMAASDGLSVSDLRLILLPHPDIYAEEELEADASSNTQIGYLDLSGSLGRSIKLKELCDVLYPPKQAAIQDVPHDSWDAIEDLPSLPRGLLPNLTHLSLALDPHFAKDVSWKHLLNMSSNMSSVTHLSLAYWPDPCLTPRALYSSVTTPEGRTIPYGGTSYYSHSLDHDWSEALLVLRILSKNLYALEYLDLTGCLSWAKALTMHSEHDFVDWTGFWGKITVIQLKNGWKLNEDAMPSEQIAYHEATETAGLVEKHIRTMRAGKGRTITVERDRCFDL